MGAVEKELKVPSILDVAREAIDAAGSDRQKAAQIMARRVRQDSALYHALLDDMVEFACFEQIKKIVRDCNDVVWTPPNADPGGRGERVKALAHGNSLMFFQLPSGFLKDATREDLKEASMFYEKQGENMLWKGRWLKLVAQYLHGKKTVGNSLTEQQLRKLQEKAANG